MSQADAPRSLESTDTLEQDTVITSESGAITLAIPARSGGGWKITYCGRDYSDDCIIAGTFPKLEFRLPRDDGGFDVFPFHASKRRFGEPYSIEPGFGRKLRNIVVDRRAHLAIALAAFIASVSGIVCNTSGDDSDGSDVTPPATGGTEPDRIG